MKRLSLWSGILALLIGIFLFVHPFTTTAMIGWIIALLVFMSGITSLLMYTNSVERSFWYLLQSILSIILMFLFSCNFPCIGQSCVSSIYNAVKRPIQLFPVSASVSVMVFCFIRYPIPVLPGCGSFRRLRSRHLLWSGPHCCWFCILRHCCP